MRKRVATNVLTHILDTPWAITEESLQTILEIVHRENPTPEAIAARLGRPLDNTRLVTVLNGVATIPIEGPLFRYASVFDAISGATSYEQLAVDLQLALNDPKVHTLLLAIDSPGGEVTGVSELAQQIRAADATKPVVAYVEGMGASAAYWLASAAREIVALDTAMLGSIGVRTTIRDTREREAARGVKQYQIVSSQSPAKISDPATPEGRSRIQATIDAVAEVFVSEVARYRGVSADTVLSEFGQGDVLVGSAAVTAGLADRLGTYESLHAELEQRGNAPPPRVPRATASTEEPPMPDPAKVPVPAATGGPQDPPTVPADLSLADLEAACAEQVATIRAEAATAERARILGIQALGGAGLEATITECIGDPTCSVDQAATKILAAERAKRGHQLTRLAAAEATLDPPPAAPVTGHDDPSAKDTARSLVALHDSVSKRGAR